MKSKEAEREKAKLWNPCCAQDEHCLLGQQKARRARLCILTVMFGIIILCFVVPH